MIKLLAPMSLLICSVCIAEEPTPSVPWYEIEMMVFTHTDQGDMVNESFSLQAPTPRLIDTIELLPPFQESDAVTSPPETAYQWLSESQLKLSQQAKQLQKSNKYSLLQHLGWRQPGLDRDTAPAILIYPYDQQQRLSLDEYTGTASVTVEPPSVAVDNQQLDEILIENELSEEASDIDWHQQTHAFGSIRLILSRYLHIENDLLLSVPTEVVITADHHLSQGFSATPYADYPFFTPEPISYIDLPTETITEQHYFRIDEKRRIRKGELHYFDHPRFGILLTVRDYIPPVEEQPEAEAATTPSQL